MASWANQIAFKLHGATNWPLTEATVTDVWLDKAGKTVKPRLNYTFWHEGHIYSGMTWTDGTSIEDCPYEKNDRIQVKFNASDPNQCYFPEQENISVSFYASVGALALIPLGLLVWYGIEHMNR
jgi:hypothetical protein